MPCDVEDTPPQVNSIAPGAINVPAGLGAMPPDLHKYFLESTPLVRHSPLRDASAPNPTPVHPTLPSQRSMGSEAAIVAAVRYLIQPENFVTGPHHLPLLLLVL